jgi:UDP-glucose 4-epimerase
MDIRSPDLRDVVVGFAPRIVYHLAAQIDVRVSVADPVRDADINVLGTINVLGAARDAAAERIVFSSSGGATFGETDRIPTKESVPRRPESPYGLSKLVVDDYFDYFLRVHGLDYVSLGFSNVYGPRQDPHGEAGVVAIFAGELLEGRVPTIYGDGLQTRDFVFVEDVTDACVRAGVLGGGRYLNVGTGVETSVVDLYRAMADLIGVESEPHFAAGRPGEQRRSCLDPAAAARHLGWEPWTSFESGLATTVDWFRSQRA